jgi:antirestriction protein
VLSTSPEPGVEEFAIHDYEGFGSIGIHEYENIEHVAALGEFIEEHGEFGAELVSHTGSLDEAKDILENRYAGVLDSLADFAEDLLEQTGQLESVPDNLRSYLDFAAYGRDLTLSGELDILRVGSELHVFWTR